MTAQTDHPYAVECRDHVIVPARDGTRLSARIWLPEGAEARPVPAILEYIPYRKRDLRSTADALIHPYFAGHGYAGVRVDMRGTGDSEGVLTDEYLVQELDDGEDILRWLAEQPWCDGNVGIIGISWGGFNGLQLAARQPPELAAVITVCSSDDRYADDVHYMGGCLLGDNLSWSSIMFANNSLPPDPRLVGDRWREMWHERLRESGLWLDTWLRHQHRDSYWRHGSVCEDYGAIRCPVYAVSGWADGYRNTIFRLLAALDVPRKGLVGPWSHSYPHVGIPGPAIGFLQECLRWWDRWLAGIDNAVMAEPDLRVWMQDSVPPAAHYDERPGRWVSEPGWPAPNVAERRYRLAPGRLYSGRSPRDTGLEVRSPLTTGLAAGKWCSYLDTPDLPVDQRPDDAGSLTFDTAPLDAPVELLGAPAVELELSADRPVAMVAARLCEVTPDGTSGRITYGVLNLTHRNGHDRPEPLVPGRRYRVRVPLNHIGQRIPAGHRLRLALSSVYWPLAWPPPEPVTLTVHTAASALWLPYRRRAGPSDPAPFPEPRTAPPPDRTVLEPASQNWHVIEDRAAGTYTVEVPDDRGVCYLDKEGRSLEMRGTEWYTADARDHGSPRAGVSWVMGLRDGDWAVRTITETELRADARAFHLWARLRAFEGEDLVYDTTWAERIPRELV